MTCFALAGNGEFLTANGESSPSALAEFTKNSGPKRLANPSAPNPMPNRFKNWRRVIAKSSGRATCSFMFMRDLRLLCSCSQTLLALDAVQQQRVSGLLANLDLIISSVQSDLSAF